MNYAELFGVDPKVAEKMAMTLEVWLDNPLLPVLEVAEKAGIGRTTFYNYRQNPAFMAEYKRRCQQRFAELEAAAIEVLANKLYDGNQRAAEFVADRVGYAPKQKLELETTKTIVVSVEE